MFLCNIALYSIGLSFHHQSHHSWVLFLLWLPLFILFAVISPLISRSILCTYRPVEFISSSFSVLYFSFFMLFLVFSRQEYWSGLPILSPVDHILSEFSTVTHLSWVALQGMSHSFIELDKGMVHVISLVSFLWLWFSFCLPLMDKDKRLMEVSCWERLTDWGVIMGLVMMGGAMLSKSLILIFVDGWAVFSPCCMTWGQTMVREWR